MTSERKALTNKHNAQRSTGPVTEEGKVVSAQNALTHGLTAHPGRIAFWEDPQAYQRLAEEIYADLAPNGAMEKSLVDRIVMLLWRDARIDRLEIAVMYHAFCNIKGMVEIMPEMSPVPAHPQPEMVTRQSLRQSFDAKLGDVVAYDLSEGHALPQVDGFRLRNHHMLMQTLQMLRKMQQERFHLPRTINTTIEANDEEGTL